MSNPAIPDELCYVTSAGLPGEFIDEQDREEIQAIRKTVPEIGHWGDLAVWLAYMDFSQDRFLISWETFRPDLRAEFLEYLQQRQPVN